MSVYVVVIADPENVSVDMVTSDRKKATLRRAELFEKHGPFTYIEMKEMEIE